MPLSRRMRERRRAEAEDRGRPGWVDGPAGSVRVPAANTLKRYGLDQDDWTALLLSQGGCCAVCRRVPENGRLCTDHEHVKGWKRMPAAERRRYVRGILCWWCNHYYVGRAITVDRAANVLEYLTRYQARRPPV